MLSLFLIRSDPKKYTLEELLAQINPENKHEKIHYGREGNELF